MPWLLVNPGAPDTQRFELTPGSNSLGRSSANDLPIDDPSISSRHCEILVERDQVTLRDLGSTNGTFVNYLPVTEAVLQPGQTIHLGKVELLFCAETPAAAGTALGTAAPRPAFAGAIPAVARDAIPLRAVQVGNTTTLELESPPLPPASARTAAPPARPTPPLGAGYLHGSTQFCKFHPKTPARFRCNQCQRHYCELCVNTHGRQAFCRACAVECVPIEVRYQRPPPPKGFYARLPGVFAYPLRGWGVLMLIVGTFMLAIVKFGGGMGNIGMRSGPGFRGGMSFGWWGLMARVVVLGYLFTYMQSIIHSTALDEEEMPSMPDLTNFWEDILLPCLQLIGLTLISFAPAIAVGVWVVATEQESTGPLLLSALVLGCLYFPMAFLSVAMLDSVAAANPLQVIPSIVKVPVEYLVALTAMGGVMGIRALGDFLLLFIFPKGLATRSIAELLGMFAAQAFWSLVSLYVLIVGMRILGLLYLTRKEKLGW